MKHLLLATLIAASLAHPALAQQTDDMTVGEVRKTDKDTKKITLRHGEIKNLGMPPMTMVFQVKDPSWLDTFKTGDAVRFRVEKTPTGVYLVTDMQPGP